MSKKFLFNAIGALVLVLAAVMYLLSVVIPENFGFFNLAWAGLILCAGWGVLLLIQGIFTRNSPVVKKFYIIGGVVLLIAGVVCAVYAALMPEELVVPIIAVVLAGAVLLGVIATGGKSWDGGDNEQVGYKTYAERKKEEEKQNEDK